MFSQLIPEMVFPGADNLLLRVINIREYFIYILQYNGRLYNISAENTPNSATIDCFTLLII